MDQVYLFNQWEIDRTIDDVSFDLDSKKLDQALKSFSEDAKLTIIEDGKTVLDIQSKQAIQDAVAKKMENYDLIFHNNGTKVIDVKTLDQSAKANTSCIARLVQIQPKAVIMEFMEYSDDLIKVDDFWYIVSRTIRILSKSVM